MKRSLAALLSLLIAMPAGYAQQPPPQVYAQQQPPQVYAQQDLERMLAPIALYPDSLLSQILMAATYPVEIVEAARWALAHPGLQGEGAVQAVQGEDWDPSVKSLVAFPQVLQRMDQNIEWTRALGDAFLAQQPQVMDTVQALRQQAQAAGNLRSSGQLVVQDQGGEIYIQPANPQAVYVPYYDPALVYYRPDPFQWAAPIALSLGFFFGRADWPHRTVRVERPVVVNRTVVERPGGWHHDPIHRRGVAYRDPAVQQRFAATQAQEPRRYQRSPARDLQDSKVLSPQPRSESRPQAQAQAQPRPQVRPQVQAQVQPQPQPPQPRLRDRSQPRPQVQAQRPQPQKARVQAERPAPQRPQVQAQRPQPQRPQVQAQRPQVQPQQHARAAAQPRPQAQPNPRPRNAQEDREARNDHRHEGNGPRS